MKFVVMKPVEYEAKYLSVDVGVRFGDEDMPYDAPCRVGDRWEAVIDLDSHTIVDWPKGKTLSFDMKVCDDGDYRLLDGNRHELVVLESEYVPNGILPGAFGDYLEMEIDESGTITNWREDANLKDFVR